MVVSWTIKMIDFNNVLKTLLQTERFKLHLQNNLTSPLAWYQYDFLGGKIFPPASLINQGNSFTGVMIISQEIYHWERQPF